MNAKYNILQRVLEDVSSDVVQKELHVFLVTQLVHKECGYLYTIGDIPHDSSPCCKEL